MQASTPSPFFKVFGHEFIRSSRLKCTKESDDSVTVSLWNVNEDEIYTSKIINNVDADEFVRIFNIENVYVYE